MCTNARLNLPKQVKEATVAAKASSAAAIAKKSTTAASKTGCQQKQRHCWRWGQCNKREGKSQKRLRTELKGWGNCARFGAEYVVAFTDMEIWEKWECEALWPCMGPRLRQQGAWPCPLWGYAPFASGSTSAWRQLALESYNYMISQVMWVIKELTCGNDEEKHDRI